MCGKIYFFETMKLVCVIAFLLLTGCACNDPRGCHVIDGVGNSPDDRRMVKEGRDVQTYQNTRMPDPSAENTVNRSDGVSLRVYNPSDTMHIDDKIDWTKVE